MNIIEKQQEDVWYIAHNNNDIYHFGVVPAGAELKTGQPSLEIFNTEDQMSERLSILTNDSEYYNNYLASFKDEEDSDYDEYSNFDPTIY